MLSFGDGPIRPGRGPRRPGFRGVPTSRRIIGNRQSDSSNGQHSEEQAAGVATTLMSGGAAATTPRTSRCSRGSRPSASAPACTSARPASWACTTSSTRSWTTPSTRPSPASAREVAVTIHPDNSITVVRRRARHPVAIMEKEGQPGGRSRADRAALRREVRGRRRLQGLGRPARRRRVGRQRALRAAAGRDPPRRPRCTPGVLARRPAGRRSRKGAALAKGAPTGTTVTFLADADIFESLDFDFRTLEERLRETAFLTRGLKISIVDERGEGQPPTSTTRAASRTSCLPQREQGHRPAQGHLLRRRVRRGRRRGGDAVELLLPGVDPLVRQQHQHPRGRQPPDRLPLGADAHPQQVRARPRPAQGEGGQPLRRGRPRRPHGRDLGEAARPPVRGPDQDQARQPRDGRLRRVDRQRRPRRVPRGEPQRGPRRDHKAVQAPRAREAARKARDLTRRKSALENSTCRASSPTARSRTRSRRALRRRGRLRRRFSQAGSRPQHPGRAAAAGQDPQRREEPHRQGAATPRSRR